MRPQGESVLAQAAAASIIAGVAIGDAVGVVVVFDLLLWFSLSSRQRRSAVCRADEGLLFDCHANDHVSATAAVVPAGYELNV
jgi:hypothetical protein